MGIGHAQPLVTAPVPMTMIRTQEAERLKDESQREECFRLVSANVCRLDGTDDEGWLAHAQGCRAGLARCARRSYLRPCVEFRSPISQQAVALCHRLSLHLLRPGNRRRFTNCRLCFTPEGRRGHARDFCQGP